MLTSRSGEIVTREEIRQQVWGEQTYVDFEHGLNQCIKQIRTALNDNSSHPLYIETIPRKGYRFLAPVTSKTVAVVLKVTASTSGIQQRVSLPVSTTDGSASAALAPSPAVQAIAPVLPNPISGITANAKITQEAVAAEKTAPEPSRRSYAGRLLGWLGVPALVLIGTMLYWHSQKASALAEKDTVVLADFANSTGEGVFDDTLKQALRIQLEQSPFLSLADDRKVNATIKLMGRSPADRLTPELTRDACQRIGSKAFFAGSIAPFGSQYVIGVKVVNCSSGDLLAEAQEQAKNKEDVLKALDRAAIKVRRNLGESLRSIETYATPIEEATTTSLEALKAYSLGRKMSAIKGDTVAIPFYKRAVELDPNFAMAYRYMSAAYTNLNEGGLAAQTAQQAYELRQKVTEREKLLIEGHYYLAVTGELDKAAQTYELGKQTYPKDPALSRNLTFIYSRLGDYERAVAQATENLHRDASNGVNYGNLGLDYVDLNRLQDAEEVYKDAERRGLDSEWLIGNRYTLAFLQGDVAKMTELVSAGQGKPGTEDLLMATQADTLAWEGKLRKARELTQRAIESALHNDAKETAASYKAAAALREVGSGNRQRAREEADGALKLAPNLVVRAMSALTLAKAGDDAQAERLAAQLDGEFPFDTLVQKYWLPSIRAAIALDRGQASQAIELLNPIGALELSSPANITVVLCPPYLRGEAYLMLHQGKAARAEFQKLIDHRGLASNFQWAALARLGLARAYTIEAETEPEARDKARAAYQDFLALWKDADADIPAYQQAKAEYKKLEGK